eukprot:scaffold71614_cov35-Phaeocystis_antarctica.AAC.2
MRSLGSPNPNPNPNPDQGALHAIAGKGPGQRALHKWGAPTPTPTPALALTPARALTLTRRAQPSTDAADGRSASQARGCHLTLTPSLPPNPSRIP